VELLAHEMGDGDHRRGQCEEHVIVVDVQGAGVGLPAGGEPQKQPAGQRGDSDRQCQQGIDDDEVGLVGFADRVEHVAGLGDAVGALKDAPQAVKGEDIDAGEGVSVHNQPAGEDDGDTDMAQSEDRTVAEPVGESAPEPQRQQRPDADHGGRGDDVAGAVAQFLEKLDLEGQAHERGDIVSQDIAEKRAGFTVAGCAFQDGPHGRICCGGGLGLFPELTHCEDFQDKADLADGKDHAEFPPGRVAAQEPGDQQCADENTGLPVHAKGAEEFAGDARWDVVVQDGKPAGAADTVGGRPHEGRGEQPIQYPRGRKPSHVGRQGDQRGKGQADRGHDARPEDQNPPLAEPAHQGHAQQQKRRARPDGTIEQTEEQVVGALAEAVELQRARQ